MLALQISLNGEIKATCGAADCETVMGYVQIKAPSKQRLASENVEYLVQCLGFPVSGDEVLKWVHAKLRNGDEISIKLVETQTANQPIDRQKFDPRDVPES